MTKLTELISTLDEIIKPYKLKQTDNSVVYVIDGIVLELRDTTSGVFTTYGKISMWVDKILLSKPLKKIYLYKSDVYLGMISL